jgi:hypothetical protein
MNIRNIATYLASSVLAVSAAAVTAHPAVDLNQYNNLHASQVTTQTYKAPNLSGEFVTMVPSAAFSQVQVQQSKPYGSSHFSLVDHFQGRRACTVFLDQNGLANPTLSSTSNLFNLVDRQSYMYSIIAHEMSHCLGLTERDDQRFYQQAVAQDKNLAPYGQALKSFSSAMHEVYADLQAVMLGASKTGDWTVLDQYLIAEKTQGFNPTHSSLMAVVELVDGIDPRRLRGMNFIQINNATNTLFRKFAMDSSGSISMNSRVGQNIMREWYATGLETKTYLRAYAEPTPSSDAVQQWIEYHRQFAEQVIGTPALKDRDALNKLYGIKAYSLAQQNQLLQSTGFAKQGPGASLYRMNENRMVNLHTIIREADRLHHGQGNSLENHQAATATWLSQMKNPQASAILGQELPKVMSEALMPVNNDYQNQRLQQAQSNIRQQFGQVLESSHIEYTNGNGQRKEVRINPIQKVREAMSSLTR